MPKIPLALPTLALALSTFLQPLPAQQPNGSDKAEPLPAGWAALDPAQWSWSPAADGSWTLTATRLNEVKTPVRRPTQVVWLPAIEWRSFILTAEAYIKGDHKNRDCCLLFGGRSPQDFFYAHLCPSVDDAHHNLMRVNNADRQSITSARNQDGIPDNTARWVPLRLEVNAEAGTVRVFVDNQPEPTLSADGQQIDWGRIGLGSFDDRSAWRNVSINGPARPSTALMDGEEAGSSAY